MSTRQTTQTYFCNDCQSSVRLAKDSGGYLIVECACGETRQVKIASKSPATWSAGGE